MSEGRAWRGTRAKVYADEGIYILTENNFMVADDSPDRNRDGAVLRARGVGRGATADEQEDNIRLFAAAFNACQSIAGPEGNPLKVAGALEEIVRAAQGLALLSSTETVGRLEDALRKAGLL